jgi:hypothetical protein
MKVKPASIPGTESGSDHQERRQPRHAQVLRGFYQAAWNLLERR